MAGVPKAWFKIGRTTEDLHYRASLSDHTTKAFRSAKIFFKKASMRDDNIVWTSTCFSSTIMLKNGSIQLDWWETEISPILHN